MLQAVGWKVLGLNPVRVMWDFSALTGTYPELGVLWALWEGWDCSAKLRALQGCVFERGALTTGPTLLVLRFPDLVNKLCGVIMTGGMVCGPVK